MTTINDFPALPASEEISDFSRDVSYTSPAAIVAGDAVRVQSGPFAFCNGIVWSVTGEQVTVFLRVFGMTTYSQPMHWTNLKKVG